MNLKTQQADCKSSQKGGDLRGRTSSGLSIPAMARSPQGLFSRSMIVEVADIVVGAADVVVMMVAFVDEATAVLAVVVVVAVVMAVMVVVVAVAVAAVVVVVSVVVAAIVAIVMAVVLVAEVKVFVSAVVFVEFMIVAAVVSVVIVMIFRRFSIWRRPFFDKFGFSYYSNPLDKPVNFRPNKCL